MLFQDGSLEHILRTIYKAIDVCLAFEWQYTAMNTLRDTQRGSALNVWQSVIALHMFSIRKNQ